MTCLSNKLPWFVSEHLMKRYLKLGGPAQVVFYNYLLWFVSEIPEKDSDSSDTNHDSLLNAFISISGTISTVEKVKEIFKSFLLQDYNASNQYKTFKYRLT
jgi:hypothetical protein